MDVKTSRKETRFQPSGSVDVLMDNITDLYPVFSAYDPDKITNLEMLDGDPTELLDRAMWQVLIQRGGDPLDSTSGVQTEECIMGEISVLVLLTQIAASVLLAGPGVKANFSTGIADGKEYLIVTVTLVSGF
jgi:hypothetical protein